MWHMTPDVSHDDKRQRYINNYIYDTWMIQKKTIIKREKSAVKFADIMCVVYLDAFVCVLEFFETQH